jgi:cyclophilin family peptidyl-prolyl cis-trans isomerase
VPRFFALVCSVVLASLLSAADASAQIVRFHTTLGPLDVVLNPTGAPQLQPYVDGFLQYVNAGAYDGVVIHRAQKDFVVQLGSLTTTVTTTDAIPSTGFDQAPPLAPVIVDSDDNGVVDFDVSAFSNTRGQVAFALTPPSPNVTTGSFFVNLSDNSFLDAQGFVPFASIPDMSLINAINDLERVDPFGDPFNLTYSDIPVVNGNQLLFVERAVVVPEPFTARLLAVVLALAAGMRNRRVG